MEDKAKELLNDLDRIYEELQQLNVQPTHSNVLILADTMNVLKNIYKYISETAENTEEKEAQEVTDDVHC